MIGNFKIEKVTGAEMQLAIIVSGIVTGQAPVSYWPFFPSPYSLVTVP